MQTAPLNINLREDYTADEWKGFKPVENIRTLRVNNRAVVTESAMERFWNMIWN